jgi:hypothetical protein
MEKLISTLAAELERPRTVSPQVVNHLIETYGTARDEIGSFLRNQIADREDYEIDLILSPLFTPTLKDQSVIAELLGRNSAPANQWPSLVKDLVARPVTARLVTEDGQTHSVILRNVTIERFVNRLCLDSSISESLLSLINNLAPAADRPLLKAIARRPIWHMESRGAILAQFLTASLTTDTYRSDDIVQLLKLAETYEPADAGELLASIPHWQQVLRQEINQASNPRPFFNERVQEMHGGGRDQRRQDNSQITAREKERDFLDRLERTLSSTNPVP